MSLSPRPREAHYVLPAQSQFEKWEATFFNFDFPHNVFHLRRPVEPRRSAMPEPEIHARLVEALGVITDDDLAPLRAAAAVARPSPPHSSKPPPPTRNWALVAPVVLYRTLGPIAARRRRRPRCWRCTSLREVASRRRFAVPGSPVKAWRWVSRCSRASSPATTVCRSRSTSGSTCRRVFAPTTVASRCTSPRWSTARASSRPSRRSRRPSGRCCSALVSGARSPPTPSSATRRGAARRARCVARQRRRCRRRRSGRWRDGAAQHAAGSVMVAVEVSEMMQPGHRPAAQRHGARRRGVRVGVAPNDLTSGADRDPIAGTPWHKSVPARLTAIG